MVFSIEETKKIAVTATAQDVDVACRTFIASNNGSNPVYIHPKGDGKAATTSDFCIPAGQVVNVPMCCETLSVIGSSGGDLRLLFGNVWG